MFGAMVVGAGFITPSGYITYIALHKEWQGYHIGGYMLYHLMMVRLSAEFWISSDRLHLES
jgi:ribosomal protein S18 acetylase RimI-like enzyme